MGAEMGKDVAVLAVEPVELKFSVPPLQKRKGGPATLGRR